MGHAIAAPAVWRGTTARLGFDNGVDCKYDDGGLDLGVDGKYEDGCDGIGAVDVDALLDCSPLRWKHMSAELRGAPASAASFASLNVEAALRMTSKSICKR